MSILGSKGYTDESVDEINKLLGSNVLKPERTLLEIELISQMPEFPNGCEAVSAVMLLRNAGFDISPAAFIDHYLACAPVSIKWGCRFGPDPKKAYAGDPRSEKNGWSCFAPVIVSALNSYLPEGYHALNLTGLSLSELTEKYLSRGIPCAIWTTVDMQELSDVYIWQSEDGKKTYMYPVNQHCCVLVGADRNHYYFDNPLGDGVTSFDKNTSVRCFNSMGMQAVAIVKAAMD